MPVFITHAHSDAEFVDKLAVHLVRASAHVWVDRWELNVGDSLIDRIESAIQDASALVVVLSRKSVASAWCKKEINAGLIRELNERKVVVLPILVEDCDIPLFLKEKRYADFRSNFDKGINEVLAAIDKVTSDVRGRVDEPDAHFDWALDWWYEDNRVFLHVVVIEAHVELPYSMLTDVIITPNDKANRRYMEFKDRDVEWVARHVIMEAIADCLNDTDFRFLIEDQFPKRTTLNWQDPKGFGYKVNVAVRMVGSDTGKNLLFNWGRQLRQITQIMLMSARRATSAETKRLRELLEKGPT